MFLAACFLKKPEAHDFETMLAYNMACPPRVRSAMAAHPVGTDPSTGHLPAADPEPAHPWDVLADVLVIVVAPDPTFDGPLGELDRRSGGELRALAAQLDLPLYQLSLSQAIGSHVGETGKNLAKAMTKLFKNYPPPVDKKK